MLKKVNWCIVDIYINQYFQFIVITTIIYPAYRPLNGNLHLILVVVYQILGKFYKQCALMTINS